MAAQHTAGRRPCQASEAEFRLRESVENSQSNQGAGAANSARVHSTGTGNINKVTVRSELQYGN